MNITVLGNGGFQGLATALGMATIGHQTIYVDRDDKLIGYLKLGIAPPEEVGMQESLESAIKLKRISFTANATKAVSGSSVIIVAGSVPGNDPARVAETVEIAANGSAAARKHRYRILVLQCRCPLGTHDMYQAKLLERLGEGIKDMDVVTNPVIAREGNALADFLMPERIIVGTYRKRAAHVMKDIYKDLKTKTIFTDPRSAEVAQAARMAYQATKIALLDEIAGICMDNGADMKKVARCLPFSDSAERKLLVRGMGFDAVAASMSIESLIQATQKDRTRPLLLDTVLGKTETRERSLVERVAGIVGGLKGKTIAVFQADITSSAAPATGARFKRTREAIEILGGSVRAWDAESRASRTRIQGDTCFFGKPGEAAKDADCILILSSTPEFSKLALRKLGSRMKNAVIFDTCHSLRPKRAVGAGFQYHAFGISPKRIPWWAGKMGLRSVQEAVPGSADDGERFSR